MYTHSLSFTHAFAEGEKEVERERRLDDSRDNNALYKASIYIFIVF